MQDRKITHLDLNKEDDLVKFNELCNGNNYIGGWFMFKGCPEIIFFQGMNKKVEWITGLSDTGIIFNKISFDKAFDLIPEKQKEHMVYMFDLLNK